MARGPMSDETKRRRAQERFATAVEEFQTSYVALIASSYAITAALADLRRLNDIELVERVEGAASS